MLSCTASAARFCRNATLPTRRRPRKPSSPLSPSRNNKKRRASSCARRWRWRSFVNRASRAADAHAVLASALEGFSPMPESPEIEEAQTFLAALAETNEVKNAAASRRRRLKLQTSCGASTGCPRIDRDD